MANDYTIPSLESAVNVLKLLGRSGFENITLTEIASAVSINTSTCLRILRTLHRTGMVSFDERTKRYSLGPTLIQLGNRAGEHIDYTQIAEKHLPAIADNLQTTVVLVKRSSKDRLQYIAKSEPTNLVRITVSIGDEFPIVSAAIGKCFMAHLPEDEVETLINQFAAAGNVSGFGRRFEPDLNRYLHPLQHIRQTGFAVSYEEYLSGIAGVAAPIFRSNLDIIFVLACLYPITTLERHRPESIGTQLKDFARTISDEFNRLNI